MSPPDGDRVLGLVESVTFVSPTVMVTCEARVDTGAKRTSLDRALAEALGIEPSGRTVKVRCASRDEPQRRDLATVPLSVGGETFRVEASLVDRGHMDHPVILGRDVLCEGGFRVAVAEAA